MRIEFLNVWGGQTGKIIENYLEQEAEKDAVDVFCFQESDKVFPEIATRALSGSHRQYKARKYINEKECFEQATWVRNGLEVADTYTILDDIKDVGLALCCSIVLGKKKFEIINMHGVSKPGHKNDSSKRLEQSEQLIANKKTKPELTIVGGDLNLNPNTRSIAMFSDANYRDLIAEFEVTTTRNKNIWDKYPLTPQMYSDYVFVGSEIKVKEFRVVQNLVSDHLPMVLEIDV